MTTQILDNPSAARTAWYAALEHARRTGDWRREREARHQLERLGVSVEYRQRPKEVGRAR